MDTRIKGETPPFSLSLSVPSAPRCFLKLYPSALLSVFQALQALQALQEALQALQEALQALQEALQEALQALQALQARSIFFDPIGKKNRL